MEQATKVASVEAPPEWGEPLQAFPVTKLYTVGNHVIGYLTFLAGVAILVLLIVFPPDELADMIIFMALGGGFIFIGVLALLMALYLKDLRCTVYPEGAVWEHGGKKRQVRWPEVEATWKQKARLIIKTIDGRTMTWSIRFLNTPGIFTHLVDDKLYAQVGPTLRDRFTQGETLDFGPLRLSQDGLQTDAGKLTWKEFDNIKVGETLAGGFVTILKKDAPTPFWHGSTAIIPNYFAFGKLLPFALGWARKQEA